MNKAIVMSTQPNWVAKILNGEKKVEVRKTKPKCELPIDVYLYCTKQGRPLVFGSPCPSYIEESYVQTYNYNKKDADEIFGNLQGKVVAKFTLNKVEEVVDNGSSYRINNDVAHTNEVARNSCLDFKDMKTYLKGKNGYAYHIDNLVIFDKPMQLSEFYKSRFEPNKITDAYEKTFNDLSKYRVTKAPQSWQYVYVKGEKE